MRIDVLKQQTILMASKDEQICECIEKAADKSKFYLIITDRITELLSKMLDVKVDLLILDLDLVGDAWLEMISVIRKVKSNLPILVVSSDHSFESGREIAKFDVWLYLLKPIRRSKIESAMNVLQTKFSATYLLNEKE